MHHKIHNRLRGVNNAIGIRRLNGKTLKKLFINRVEKALFFRIIINGRGSAFKHPIKMIELFQKLFTAEGAGGQRSDHLFNFPGDDVFIDEVGIIEHLAENALGQQMLNEHFFNSGDRQIGIDGFLTEAEKACKRGGKMRIAGAFLLDDHQQRLTQFLHLVLETGDGFLPLLIGRRLIAEKQLQGFDQ